MINTLIDLLNNQFDGIVPDQIVLGLVQRIYRHGDNAIEFMPGIVDADGEAIYAGIEDIKSLSIYHKANTANLTYGNMRVGFGDSRQSEDSINCSIIACWDIRKVKLQSVDMLLLLRSRLPQMIKGVPGIKSILITPTGAILDTKQVFGSEYTVAETYLLPIYINFLQINYTIQLRYDQQCIDQCINC